MMQTQNNVLHAIRARVAEYARLLDDMKKAERTKDMELYASLDAEARAATMPMSEVAQLLDAYNALEGQVEHYQNVSIKNLDLLVEQLRQENETLNGDRNPTS